MEINKLTARLQEQGVEIEQLSDSDIYISGNLDIDKMEEVFASMNGYKIEFIKEEPITYN
jgi:hypothetical protein